jgi:hypothetical protein
MNKIKKWVWTKLREFLCIDNIEKEFGKHEMKNEYEINSLRDQINTNYRILNEDISHFQESVNILHKTVENVVHIGTDVDYNPNNHSWAVVCVEGKMNLVKFISLSDKRDAMDILNFLKQFEAGKHCIDTPAYAEFFHNELFKFGG